MNTTTSRLKGGFVLRCPVEDDLLPKSQIMGSEDHTVFIKVCFHFYLYCMVFYSTILFLTKSLFLERFICSPFLLQKLIADFISRFILHYFTTWANSLQTDN